MAGSNGHNRDDGADRHTRRHPCIRRTWCVLELDHDGFCVELPRVASATRLAEEKHG